MDIFLGHDLVEEGHEHMPKDAEAIPSLYPPPPGRTAEIARQLGEAKVLVAGIQEGTTKEAGAYSTPPFTRFAAGLVDGEKASTGDVEVWINTEMHLIEGDEHSVIRPNDVTIQEARQKWMVLTVSTKLLSCDVVCVHAHNSWEKEGKLRIFDQDPGAQRMRR